MAKLIVVGGLSAIIGLAVGFAAFSMPAPLPPPECPAPSVCPPAVVCPSVAELSRAVPTAAAAAPAADCATMQVRLSELEAALSAEKAKTDGTPRPFPKTGVDPAYTSAPLLDAFRRGLGEAGFSGDVSAIDCSEYPCVVFGSGFGAAGDSAKLKATSAFAPYQHSGWSTFGFNAKATDPQDRFFGMAVLPPGESMNDDQDKRLKFRMNQMWDASRPRQK